MSTCVTRSNPAAPRPVPGTWLLPVLLGAVGAGVALAGLEWTYIVLACGPFWLSAVPLVTTLLAYTAATVVGSSLLGLVTYLVPPLRRRLEQAWARFIGSMVLAGVGGGGLLILLVFRDLDSASGSMRLMGLFLALAAVLALALGSARAGRRWGPGRGLLLSIALCVGVLGVVGLLSARHYTALLRQRSIAFSGERPHVCLLVIDTARADHFSCYGYPFPTSPHIDRLAQEGLLNTNAFSASNWTTPGHISIFTGKYPPQHGNDGHAHMPDELVSLTEILRQHGYFCLGLYNNFLAGRDVNITQGFDLGLGVFTDTWVYPAVYRLWSKFRQRDHGASLTFPLAQRACRWIQKRGGHVFLYVNVLEPHDPYVAHEPYFSAWTRDLAPDKVTKHRAIARLCRGNRLAPGDSTLFAGFTSEEYAYLRAFYDSEIAYLDAQIGRFTDALDQNGILDETLLVLTADHGEFLGEQFTMRHPAMLMDPVLRIPFILRWPRRILAGVNTEPVSNVDVLPTVLGLLECAGDVPRDVEGVDLLAGERSPGRPLLSARLFGRHGCYCLIEGRRKLFINQDWRLREHWPYEMLLFDAELNPREDIRPESARTPEALEMQRRLEAWLSRITVRPEVEMEIDPALIERMKGLGYIG